MKVGLVVILGVAGALMLSDALAASGARRAAPQPQVRITSCRVDPVTRHAAATGVVAPGPTPAFAVAFSDATGEQEDRPVTAARAGRAFAVTSVSRFPGRTVRCAVVTE